MSIVKRCIVVIDPQNDFCRPDGALSVPNAETDLANIASLIQRNLKNLPDIILTLDSHNRVDISHPLYWQDKNGLPPNPFTIVTPEMIENGDLVPVYPWMKDRSLDYVKALEANSRYALCIWPEHCLIGTEGHLVHPILMDAVKEWELENRTNASYFTKGSNIFTEHYSVVKADVPDPSDPSTKVNTEFLDTLNRYDEIWVGGEASSHCVKFSVEDIIENFGPDAAKKLVIMEDAMSPVPGFETAAEEFLTSMRDQGIRVLKTTDF